MRLGLALPVPLLAAMLLAGGCTLVDQRTFQAAAPAPTGEELARARVPLPPLMSVRLGATGVDYRPALAEVVRDAMVRNPDASFDVMALVPTQAAPAEQDRRVAEGAQDALAVATAMNAAGVPQEKLHLGLRGDPGSPAREVRIYLR